MWGNPDNIDYTKLMNPQWARWLDMAQGASGGELNFRGTDDGVRAPGDKGGTMGGFGNEAIGEHSYLPSQARRFDAPAAAPAVAAGGAPSMNAMMAPAAPPDTTAGYRASALPSIEAPSLAVLSGNQATPAETARMRGPVMPTSRPAARAPQGPPPSLAALSGNQASALERSKMERPSAMGESLGALSAAQGGRQLSAQEVAAIQRRVQQGRG